MTAPIRYRVTLVPLPGSPAPIVRLRLALKALLRAHRLRCEAVERFPGRSSGKRGAL